jgi:AraC-like DNA-binding protein
VNFRRENSTFKPALTLKKMEHLKAGQFFGETNITLDLNGITLTDTEYTHDRVDWHYHENAYFTFILQGNVIEKNRKQTYHCSAGTLLFHNWQDAHFNIKPPGFTRGFHIEMEQAWVNKYNCNLGNIQGNISVGDPDLKLLLYAIFRETKMNDVNTPLSVQSLLLNLLSGMQGSQTSTGKHPPVWVSKLREILNEKISDSLSLQQLSALLDIHPVHLSRDFSRYFKCNLGTYIRKQKVQKSLSLISDKSRSLTDISFECGFSDQSHFNRCFRENMAITPLAYRKLLFS